MQGATGLVQFVFEPVNLLLQLVPLLAVPVPILIGALVFATQPLDLSLLPLEFGDQVVARRRAPGLSHASVMPRLDREYKRKRWRSRRSGAGSEVTTR
jgi:hypothetical protein